MPDTPDQVAGGLSTASIPVTAPAVKGGMGVKGTIALDPTQTSEILSNMQQMIDQRAGAQNLIFGGPNYNTAMSSLKDATAWGSGGVQGPTQALAVRDEQKAKEARDLFEMRTQMASYKAAQAQQEAFNKRRQSELGGLTSGVAGGAGTGGVGGMPAEIRQALSNARSEDEYNKIYNDYASTVAKAKTGFEYNPAAYKRDVEVSLPGGRYELVDAITAKKLASMGIATIPEFTQAGKPNAPTAAVAAAPAAGAEGVPLSVRNNNPGNIVDPKTGQFRVFKSPEEGAKALEEDLKLKLTGQSQSYKSKFGDTPITPSKLAETWSPAAGKGNTPESTANYGKFIAKNLGIDANQPIEYTPENLAKIKTAITQFEAGSYTPSRPAVAGGAPAPRAGIEQPSFEAPGQRLTLPEAKARLTTTESGLAEELKKNAADIATYRATTIEAHQSSAERLASADYLNGLMKNNPKTFGVLQHADVLSGVASALEKGINAGPTGTIGLQGIDDAVRKAMPGSTQADVDAAQKAARQFALMQLQEAKIVLKGQGAVSDAERQLVRDLTGSIKNSPAALRDMLKWGTMRADYDKRIGDLYEDFERARPNVSYREFMLTPQYKAIRGAYEKQVLDFGRSTDTGAAKSTSGTESKTPVLSGTTTGGFKWKVVQ